MKVAFLWLILSFILNKLSKSSKMKRAKPKESLKTTLWMLKLGCVRQLKVWPSPYLLWMDVEGKGDFRNLIDENDFPNENIKPESGPSCSKLWWTVCYIKISFCPLITILVNFFVVAWLDLSENWPELRKLAQYPTLSSWKTCLWKEFHSNLWVCTLNPPLFQQTCLQSHLYFSLLFKGRFQRKNYGT